MDILIAILLILILAIEVIGGWFLKNYFPSYMDEKGKNLATKEDVEEITALTEEVQREFKENFELFSADLKFKNEFIYKQYSALYCRLYAIVTQSEYVRKYIRIISNQDFPFDEEPFIEISPTEHTETKLEVNKSTGTKLTREVTYRDTPISKFNKMTLCEYIIEDGALASPQLLKLAVSYRFANEHMKSTIECEDKERAKEEAEKQEVVLIKEIVMLIVKEYNEMRKFLRLDYNETELSTGRLEL